jgi:cephalosporin-C deacetylase-like acetyl esterase
MKKLLLILCAFFAVEAMWCNTSSAATPSDRAVKIIVMPDHLDWSYKCGEKPVFKVLVLKHHSPMQNVEIRYELSEDNMPAHKTETMVLKSGEGTIKIGTMKVPGFLRCKVYVTEGENTYRGLATAGFNVENIRPTTEMPTDFDDFWQKALKESAKIPLEPVLTLQPEKCTHKYNVYNVKFRNGEKDFIYGLLTVPKKPGKFPAVLKVPGANVRPYDIAKDLVALGDVVTLKVGIHGIPIDMEGDVYSNLKHGALKNYNRINIQDRDKYYYKRVYIGCARAVDLLADLEFVDANRIAVCGGSQGGALSFTTAYLNPKVKCLYAFYPALADLGAYLHKRSAGWPHLFRTSSDDNLRNEKVMQTIKYYDIVNFARKTRVPVKVALGYNDTTCCPTSMFSVYNVVPTTKELYLLNEIGHYIYDEMYQDRNKWLLEHIK